MTEDELKVKAREMAEILFEHHEPEAKALIMEHFRTDTQERVKAFMLRLASDQPTNAILTG